MGAKGAVEIIFRGKDLKQREAEYVYALLSTTTVLLYWALDSLHPASLPNAPHS